MIKKVLLAFVLLAPGLMYAQNFSPCLTDQIKQQHIIEHPELVKLEQEANSQILRNQVLTLGKATSIRYIPVVFHIISKNGVGNISQAQIMDEIRILNEDYRKKAGTNGGKSTNAVAADLQFEFRLAQYDPNGNKHDGINRIESSLADSARDNVKALSYWDSNKYLNIWVVNTIANSGAEGTVLGYAQFPWERSFKPTTDGVVVRYDQIGVIGSGQVSQAGRTLTHEIGHWMGLYHTFQDGCVGGTTGTCSTQGDQVCDTPPVSAASFGCKTGANTCTNDSPDLPDMIQNYMDYSDGTCMELFTEGQKSRMHSSMSSYRSTLYTNAVSYAGIDPTTGEYLSVTAATLKTPYTYAFSSSTPASDKYVINNFGNPANGWKYNGSVGYNSSSCMYMRNFANTTAVVNSRDGFQTPEFDLSTNPTPYLEFYYAYAQKSSANTDSLSLFISNDYGMHEIPLFGKVGPDLATVAAPVSTEFVPASDADWKRVSINLAPYLSYTHARFRFEFLNRRGNNVYVDNFTISKGATGIEEQLKASFRFAVAPNPSSSDAAVSFTLKEYTPMNITLKDMLGRDVKMIQQGGLAAGEHTLRISRESLPTGVYFIHFTAGETTFTHKLLIN